MPTLTPDGQRLVQELSRRHGFSEQAVADMLDAVVAGQGRMAQFAHREFGGNGQWMSGGMLMIGDMFNDGLKVRVGNLCTELANALDATDGSTSLVSSGGSSAWWPPELGTPSATGSQNAMRYACFARIRRLAIEVAGKVRVHDTLDHRLSGFSQQQGGSGTLAMSSQHGPVDLATLPLVSGEEQAARSSSGSSPAAVASARSSRRVAGAGQDPSPGLEQTSCVSSGTAVSRAGETGQAHVDEPVVTGTVADDPVRLIERLGELHERGLLTDDEFAEKKQELLKRL